jgi:phage gp29-like protein
MGLVDWAKSQVTRIAAPLVSQITQSSPSPRLDAILGEITPGMVSSALSAAQMGNIRAAMQLFETMEARDGMIASHLRDRRMAASSIPYSILAADLDDDAPDSDRELADEIRDDCERLMWRIYDRPTRQNLFGGIGSGLAVLDIRWTADRKSGRVDVDGLERVEPTALNIDDDMRLRVMTLSSGWQGEPLTPWRYVVHQHPGRPGRVGANSLLQPLAALFVLKRWSWKDWAIFAELFGQPIRIGKHRVGADATEVAAIRSMLENLGVAA